MRDTTLVGSVASVHQYVRRLEKKRSAMETVCGSFSNHPFIPCLNCEYI